VCTVLLRFEPTADWPILLGAMRDEFVARPWDPPGAHWGGRVLGGRDRVAGGTWLAVDPDAPAVAAVLNGVHLLDPADPARLSRGVLPLAALAGEPLPDPPTLARYDGFHLLLATPSTVDVWTWDGRALTHQKLAPGDHIDFECLHDNGVTRPVKRDGSGNPTTLTFGLTTDDEMCVLVGTYY